MPYIHQLIAAEVLAKAASNIFPDLILMDMQIDSAGFAYDIAFLQQVDSHATPLLEENMRDLIKQQIPIQILEMMRENAANLLEHCHQPVKAEGIAGSLYNVVQIIKIDTFYDYLPSIETLPLHDLHTGLAGAIKILSIEEVATGSEDLDKYKILKITGTAAENKQDLKQLVKKHEFIKNHHPLKLGPEMGLFVMAPQIDPKSIFWCDKGVFLREALHNLWKKNSAEREFHFIETPHAVSFDFIKKWKVESHDFLPFEGHHTFFVRNKIPLLAEYLSLVGISGNSPWKLAEWSAAPFEFSFQNPHPALPHHTTGYRLIGCNETQVHQEIISFLQFFDKCITILGFRCEWVLVSSSKKTATRSQYLWDRSLDYLKTALSACGHVYTEDQSRASPIGPRVELQVRDVLDRRWTLSTLEINLAYAQQLKLTCQNLEKKGPPVLISEVLFTSIEQVIALLIEVHGGMLPWQLAPEQIRVLPIGKHQLAYASQIACLLKEGKFRVCIDLNDDPLSGKIHRAETAKIPYLVIVGEKEAKEKTITIRPYGQNALKKSVSLKAFMDEVLAAKKDESIDISHYGNIDL